MKYLPSGKDKRALFKTFSGISGNISAGWIGLIFIAPGISPSPLRIEEIILLTKSVAASIIFAWFSYKLERMSK